jgi:hypothetical protein
MRSSPDILNDEQFPADFTDIAEQAFFAIKSGNRRIIWSTSMLRLRTPLLELSSSSCCKFDRGAVRKESNFQ